MVEAKLMRKWPETAKVIQSQALPRHESTAFICFQLFPHQIKPSTHRARTTAQIEYIVHTTAGIAWITEGYKREHHSLTDSISTSYTLLGATDSLKHFQIFSLV